MAYKHLEILIIAIAHFIWRHSIRYVTSVRLASCIYNRNLTPLVTSAVFTGKASHHLSNSDSKLDAFLNLWQSMEFLG